jgi:hypothetical protein
MNTDFPVAISFQPFGNLIVSPLLTKYPIAILLDRPLLKDKLIWMMNIHWNPVSPLVIIDLLVWFEVSESELLLLVAIEYGNVYPFKLKTSMILSKQRCLPYPDNFRWTICGIRPNKACNFLRRKYILKSIWNSLLKSHAIIDTQASSSPFPLIFFPFARSLPFSCSFKFVPTLILNLKSHPSYNQTRNFWTVWTPPLLISSEIMAKELIFQSSIRNMAVLEELCSHLLSNPAYQPSTPFRSP